jgi:hypothetical protein
MLHGACTPATTSRESRGNVQPFVGAVRATKVRNFEGNDEPSLDEVLGDDVIRRVMARDGVQPDHVWSLVDVLRNRLR